ncbi:hypothetical protein [Brevundimonas sp. NPDC058933]|uniref:hypothetical protein n=1 Tax=Brevundimonas sp. NPDC058933 TaxID=3346673 RepID=UPI003BEEB298
MAVSFQHKRGTRAQIASAAAQSQLKVGEIYFMTDEQRPVIATASNAYQSIFSSTMSVSVSGKPANGEIVGCAIFPLACVLTAGNCSAQAITAATASTVFTIKNKTSGSTVGTITFAAGATLATISITSASIAANTMLYIEAPATADAALANIAFVVRA